MLLNSWEFDQLVKIPALFRHYTQHLNQDGNISFFGFLKMHYQSGRENNNEGEHKNLPFKSHECQNLTQILVLEVYEPELSALIPFIFDVSSSVNEDFYDLENVASIWQPPQLG